jgi:hypothetical protein
MENRGQYGRMVERKEEKKCEIFKHSFFLFEKCKNIHEPSQV